MCTCVCPYVCVRLVTWFMTSRCVNDSWDVPSRHSPRGVLGVQFRYTHQLRKVGADERTSGLERGWERPTLPLVEGEGLGSRSDFKWRWESPEWFPRTVDVDGTATTSAAVYT